MNGIAAHLHVEDLEGHVILDEDVNRVEVTTRLRWATWEPRRKSEMEAHDLSLNYVSRIELSRCRDRLKRDVS